MNITKLVLQRQRKSKSQSLMIQKLKKQKKLQKAQKLVLLIEMKALKVLKAWIFHCRIRGEDLDLEVIQVTPVQNNDICSTVKN